MDLKEKDEFILLFKIVLGKTARVARNLINFVPLNKSDDLYLFFCLSLSIMLDSQC